MQSLPETAVLVFEDIEFDVVDIRNVPWLRGLQVASALGYRNPTADIQNLFARNADEFTDEMTQVVELDTAGGRQPVRIFSPRGCYLLG
ncbi:BRO-N domain-containing protein, partial [Ralstonia mannitolilytica]|uniref:BRO-N domain-containing protein n=1 Tax=Ralstonia mannitolilytica TaxID=105219 RepID=UPI00292FB58D